MTKMKVEYRDIDEVLPYHNNPRKNDGSVVWRLSERELGIVASLG